MLISAALLQKGNKAILIFEKLHFKIGHYIKQLSDAFLSVQQLLLIFYIFFILS